MVLALLFAVTMLVAAAWDVATYEIPDTLSVLLVAGALIGLIAGGSGLVTVAVHGAAALLMFGLGVVLFSLRLWGGGDVKFLAATSLWFGWHDLPAYLLAVSLAGGVLALAVLALRRLPLSAAWAAAPWLLRLRGPDQPLPYGVALGAGGLLLTGKAVAGIAGPTGLVPALGG